MFLNYFGGGGGYLPHVLPLYVSRGEAASILKNNRNVLLYCVYSFVLKDLINDMAVSNF